MTRRKYPDSMWADACELLDRADRLQRQFFRPAVAAAGASWEPPADVFESARALWVVVALPGVPAEQIELRVDGGTIVVAGARPLPTEVRGAAIHRLEIPAGRFERRIHLPPGRYELAERRYADGCLSLVLRKRAADWS
jgi:HSP20 family molecular chaperone IbpA